MPSRVDRSERYQLTFYPAAGEAAVSFVPSAPPRPASSRLDIYAAGDLPVRSRYAQSMGTLRRYIKANDLTYLRTLTYGAPVFDPDQVNVDMRLFTRRWYQHGERGPWAWVQEWHPGGHGLHVHYAVGTLLVDSAVQAAWGRGFTHATPWLSGDEDWSAGRVASYLTKDPVAGSSGHRYHSARGYTPTVERHLFDSVHDALHYAQDRMGAPPTWQRDTDQCGGVWALARW